MNHLFVIHCVVVTIGVLLSLVNLRASWRDLRIVSSHGAHGVVEIVAKSWVVREVIHLFIQLTFVSFIVLLLFDDSQDTSQKTMLLELRAIWVASFVSVLSLWDLGVRKRLNAVGV